MNLNNNGYYENEYRTIVPNDGKSRWIRLKGKVIFDSENNPDRVTGIMQDITERKIAEEALRESEERFRSLADQSPLFVFIVEPGPDAKMSYFNKNWLEYTGRNFEEAIGRAWDQIIHPDDVSLVMDIYIPAFQNRELYTIPAVRVKHYTGAYRWHMFKGNPRHLSNGEFIGYVGVGIDIHDQKLALEQLELNNTQLKRINNDLDNFIYTASHDLKAPMSNIEGLLNALRSSLETEPQILSTDTENLLGLMNESIDRFKNTILDLTEISKVQREQEEDLKEIKLKEIIEDVKMVIHDKIVESKAIIDINLSVEEINFSRKNIKSIFYNL
jgi:PAS domain S-box-containing protein